MKINVIFPYNTWGGAYRSTYEICNRLIERGHVVIIYYPIIPFLEGNSIFSFRGLSVFLRGIFRSIFRGNKVPWFDLMAETRTPFIINDFFIDNADIIVANHWMTAQPVFNLSKNKGKKFYFIRDVEDWADYFKFEIEAFKLPMKRLVVSQWIELYLKKNLGLEVAGIINNGININSFSSNNKKSNDRTCLGFLYAEHPMKDSEFGFKILKALKAKYPNVRILIFGFPPKPNLPFDFEYVRRPTGNLLKKVYGEIDIFLFTSQQEGWGNPPLEAMAAECAVVTTNVGCVSERVIPGVTGLVCPPRDFNRLFCGVEKLILASEMRIQMGRAAKLYLKEFSWDVTVDHFISAITK